MISNFGEAAVADQAYKSSAPSLSASWLVRGIKAEGTMTSQQETTSAAQPEALLQEPSQIRLPTGASRDWSSALDLIREATEAINISEERAADLEAELQQARISASEELRQLKGQIAAAERRIEKAEERAHSAEARAKEAEAWLVRIHDAVLNGFRRKTRTIPSPIVVSEQDSGES
jgi:chromosome segregation ATPase